MTIQLSDDVEVQEEESNVTTTNCSPDDDDHLHQRSDLQPSMMINLDTIKRRLFHRRNNATSAAAGQLQHQHNLGNANSEGNNYDDDEKTYSSPSSVLRFFVLLCLRAYRWLFSSLLCCSHRKVRKLRVDNWNKYKKKKYVMFGVIIIASIFAIAIGQRVLRSIRRYRRRSVDPSVISWSYPHVAISNKTMLANNSTTASSYDTFAVNIAKINSNTHYHHNYGIDNTRIIFVLSMGQDASKSTIVERCLLSIRRRGEYLGFVVLLTDAPYSRYQRLQDYDSNFIVLHPQHSQDWNWKLRNDMPYKRFKTYILEYIEKDSRFDTVQLVYYIDIDIVIGKPLMHMFHYLESKYNITQTMSNVVDTRTKSSSTGTSTTTSDSHVYFFKGNYPWRPLQGGQFILIRYNSDYCLHKWRYYIDEHPQDDKDQSVLTLLLNESLKQESEATLTTSAAVSMSSRMELHSKNAAATNHSIAHNQHHQHCHFSIMEQYPHLQFVNVTTMIDLTTKIPPEKFPTMIHIKNTEHGHWISNDIQEKFFQRILNITSRKELYYIGGKTRIQPSTKQWSMN